MNRTKHSTKRSRSKNMSGVRRSFGAAREQQQKKSYLANWKKQGEIVVFLHGNSGVGERMKHVIPYVDVDEKGNKKIGYMNFVCVEEPESYDTENPQVCPIEMFMSYLINNQNIADNEIVWEAACGTDNDRVITKAGFLGEDPKRWKDSFVARHEYIFMLIEAEHPERGIQIDTETEGLWWALNRCINNEQKSKGEELGNPEINPYAFRFIYDARESPARKYDVATFARAEVTPEIQKLLAKPAVSMEGMLKSTGVKKLREVMEACIQVEVDFNLLFESAGEEDNTDFDTKKMDEDAAKKKESAKKGRKSKKDDSEKKKSTPPLEKTETKPAEPELPEGAVICELCNGTGKIGKKKNKCSECEGAGYTIEAQAEMVPCELCDGTGKIGKRGTTCPDCDGTGEVTEEIQSVCYNCNKEFAGEPENCPFCNAELDWS